MMPNARIISLKTQTGADGRGEPVYGDELLTHHLPVELIAPKSYRVEADRNRDIRNDAMLWMNRSMLFSVQHELAVGDRIVIKRDQLMATETEYEVTDINPKGNGNVLEITLGERDDEAGGA